MNRLKRWPLLIAACAGAGYLLAGFWAGAALGAACGIAAMCPTAAALGRDWREMRRHRKILARLDAEASTHLAYHATDLTTPEGGLK